MSFCFFQSHKLEEMESTGVLKEITAHVKINVIKNDYREKEQDVILSPGSIVKFQNVPEVFFVAQTTVYIVIGFLD